MRRRETCLQDGAFERAATALGWEPKDIEIAGSFVVRLGGLIARSPCTPSGSPRILAFPDCSAVHTCCMRYPIDVAFIDGWGSVLVLYRGVVPWRFLSCAGAIGVLERASLLEGGSPCLA